MPDPEAPSAHDVAEWMLARLKDVGFLPRYLAAFMIRSKFGEDFDVPPVVVPLPIVLPGIPATVSQPTSPSSNDHKRG